MNEPANKTKKNLILFFLLILFAGPFAASFWMLNYTDIGKGESGYNHGQLIQPPRQLDNLTLLDPSQDQVADLHGKWSLVYLVDNGCDEKCDQILHAMGQIRLAMNKDAHRLQRVLLGFGDNGQPLSDQQRGKYQGQLTAVITQERATSLLTQFTLNESPLDSGAIYVIDPLGNLMMRYPPEADPSGIIRDLKRLLKYSRIG